MPAEDRRHVVEQASEQILRRELPNVGGITRDQIASTEPTPVISTCILALDDLARKSRLELPRLVPGRRALPAAARPDPAAPALDVQGPDVRVGGLAAVDRRAGVQWRRF